jgi:hypothetical protein
MLQPRHCRYNRPDLRRAIAVVSAFVTTLTPFAAACRARSEPAVPVKDVIVWRAIGSWSGHGNVQTESFTSETGTLRVQWQTSDEAPPGYGTFRLTAHSAISGRPLEQVVEQRGAGSGTGYINQDPRVFYLLVESARLSWKFTVEEGFAGQVSGQGR